MKYELCYVLFTAEKYAECIKYAGESLKTYDNDSCLLSFKIKSLYELNLTEDIKAIAPNIDNIDEDSNQPYNIFNKALCYSLAGDHEKAELLCNKLIESNRNDSGFYHLHGNVKYEQGLYEDSVSLYLKAVNRLDEENQELFSDLGISYLKLDELNKAKFWLNKSLSMNPKRSDTMYYMGLYYEKMNVPEKSSEYIHNSADRGYFKAVRYLEDKIRME